jgi:hypothetical protein
MKDSSETVAINRRDGIDPRALTVRRVDGRCL